MYFDVHGPDSHVPREHEIGTNPTIGGGSPTKRVQERIVELRLAVPGPELLDEFTECVVLGLKVDSVVRPPALGVDRAQSCALGPPCTALR